MSAVKGLTILSSVTLFSAAAVHSSKRPAVDFSQRALNLDHGVSTTSVLPRANDGAKAVASLAPAAIAARLRQL